MKFISQMILLPFVALLSVIAPAFAFQLQPMSKTFAPAGTQSTQSYQVVNDGKEQIAVELSIVTRQMDLSGKENYQDANNDFLIYPPQILLKPGEAQTVRVTWLGDPQPKQELAYRLVAKQLPIDFSNANRSTTKPVGQVRVLLSYMGSLYVRPDNTQSNVVLQEIALQNQGENAPQIALTLRNQGTSRASLKNFNLHLKSQSGAIVHLQPERLKEINNQTILAGQARRFVIPFPKELPIEPITASFDFTKED